MKIASFLFLFFVSLNSFSQAWFELYPFKVVYSFEDTVNLEYLNVDTVTNPNNVWEIGQPQKTVFVNGNSSPTAIVTDTLMPYPINDTSEFIIEVPVNDFTLYHVYGDYFVDSDTINDYGKIEVSYDHGANWIMISDDTSKYLGWGGDTLSFPWTHDSLFQLTGSSGGWKHFNIHLEHYENVLSYYSIPATTDTALYKFSFISDGNFDNRDGLMFDNITIVSVYAFSLEELEDQNFGVYPNPNSTGTVFFKDKNINEISIKDMQGKVVLTQKYDKIESIDISELPNGVYLLVATVGEEKRSCKLIKS